MVADVAVLPCGPTGPEAWALTQSVELVQEAMEVRPEMKAFVLVTRKIVGSKIGSDAQSTFSEWGLPVLESELCMRVAYQEAVTGGELVTSYAEGQPAGDEVRALVNELWRDDAEGKARRERNRQTETTNAGKRSRAR
jgi:chromosome partitioning protein